MKMGKHAPWDEDLSEKEFGVLTVGSKESAEIVRYKPSGRVILQRMMLWQCQCKKCGRIDKFKASFIRSNPGSCGPTCSARREPGYSGKARNRIGDTYGTYLVLAKVANEDVDFKPHKNTALWRCQCKACGRIKVMKTAKLVRCWRSCGEKCPGRIRPKKKERIKRVRVKTKTAIIAIKNHYGCMNPACCWTGPLTPRAIDFHHKEGESKDFNVSSLATRKAHLAAREIRKCVTLCANCHRLAHSGAINLSEVATCVVDDELNFPS
jgi:hypothetical protein